MSNPDLRARDYILSYCEEMRVEDHRLFEFDLIRAAWPPTGEADDSPAMSGIITAGEFKALAAAFAGNRPDPGSTSIEALRANLGRDFRVHERPEQHAIEVHRVRARNT